MDQDLFNVNLPRIRPAPPDCQPKVFSIHSTKLTRA